MEFIEVEEARDGLELKINVLGEIAEATYLYSDEGKQNYTIFANTRYSKIEIVAKDTFNDDKILYLYINGNIVSNYHYCDFEVVDIFAFLFRLIFDLSRNESIGIDYVRTFVRCCFTMYDYDRDIILNFTTLPYRLNISLYLRWDDYSHLLWCDDLIDGIYLKISNVQNGGKYHREGNICRITSPCSNCRNVMKELVHPVLTKVCVTVERDGCFYDFHADDYSEIIDFCNGINVTPETRRSIVNFINDEEESHPFALQDLLCICRVSAKRAVG